MFRKVIFAIVVMAGLGVAAYLSVSRSQVKDAWKSLSNGTVA